MIIKIKYKNQEEFFITADTLNQEQINSIINSLHKDFDNIDYYKVEEIDT